MAHRRLEAAIEAGKVIEEGLTVSEFFEEVHVESSYSYSVHRGGVFSIRYTHDGNHIGVGFGDGHVELLNSHGENKYTDIPKHRFGALAVTCLRFHPKKEVCFVATSEGKVHTYSLADGVCSNILSESGNQTNCLDFNLEGKLFATAGKDFDVRVYDAGSYRHIRTYEGYRFVKTENAAVSHSQRIFALKFHPDRSEVFITAGWDNYLKLWDVRTKDGVQRTIYGPHICGDSVDIKGRQILTGSWVAKDALQIWDYGEGELIQNVPFEHSDQGEFLYCARFCDNDVVVSGGSGTGNVQAINVLTSQLVGKVQLDHPVQALDCSNGGRRLAVGGAGTDVKLLAMS